MWIKNVRMDDGFYRNGEEKRTKSKEVALEIVDEHITQIADQIPSSVVEVEDAHGYLVLPALFDQHIHLDKGHYGAKEFRAVVPKPAINHVFHRIEEERQFLQEFVEYIPERAQALIDLIQHHGAVGMRVQVNADPVIGLQNYKGVRAVLEDNADRLDFSMVAFPQHGALEHAPILEQMLQLGCEVLGGLDPATIDFDIEKSLQLLFSLAKNYDVPLDIHLHNQGSLGIYEMERIFHYTEKYQKEGQVAFSHGIALASLYGNELRSMGKKMHALGISLNTTVPIHMPHPDFVTLREEGVRVHIINDNINDHWSPFGTGDLIERASRGAEVFSQNSEPQLAKIYETISYNGKSSIAVGDKANLLFIQAQSAAHVIARIPKERVLMKDGRWICGTFA